MICGCVKTIEGQYNRSERDDDRQTNKHTGSKVQSSTHNRRGAALLFALSDIIQRVLTFPN